MTSTRRTRGPDSPSRLREPTWLDKSILLILVPLWAVAFVLGIQSQLDGAGSAQVGLSIEDASSYPVLTGISPGAGLGLARDLLGQPAGISTGLEFFHVSERP